MGAPLRDKDRRVTRFGPDLPQRGPTFRGIHSADLNQGDAAPIIPSFYSAPKFAPGEVDGV